MFVVWRTGKRLSDHGLRQLRLKHQLPHTYRVSLDGDFYIVWQDGEQVYDRKEGCHKSSLSAV